MLSAGPANLLLLALLLWSIPSQAQEWTRFRGPNGSGVSAAATIPAEWTRADENWRVPLPGVGHSSPVLWGTRLFVTSGDEETGTRYVVCINRADGKPLWTRDEQAPRFSKHKLNSFASSTPAVDAKRLYHLLLTSDALFAVAVDHAGNELWRSEVGPFKAGHGYGISPVLFEDTLIVGNEHNADSAIVALDVETGDVRWRTPRDPEVSYATPCVYQPKAGQAELIFTNWKRGITAIDARNGELRWEANVFDQSHVESSIGSPIVVGDLVLGTCGWLGHGMQTVAVRPDASNPGRGVEAYRVDRGAPLTTTPVAAHGLLFLWADNGIVTCVDARNGEPVWKERVGGNYYGSPVVAGRHVYCMSAEGECVVLAAERKYQLAARVPLGEGSHATPAVAAGVMYLRTFSQLISIGGE